uniref:Uncharacterized protein n=1 Tax=viral metagenome TaxID=1070528 RepID=A0A6C0D7V3_9ZZZZ
MVDIATIMGFLIILACGMIVLRYLCSFAYGLFCYNPPKHSEEHEIIQVVTPENIMHVSNHRIIRVIVTDDSHDINNQKPLPIAAMV